MGTTVIGKKKQYWLTYYNVQISGLLQCVSFVSFRDINK